MLEIVAVYVLFGFVSIMFVDWLIQLHKNR